MSVVPAGIRELLEQRGTYREWLRRLDEVGGQYRSDVAERVRADYQARLEGVAAELEGHRHEIVSTLDRRRDRLEELSGGFERRSAELEEAELRFQVGEFDDATWEDRRAELTEGLEEIETELSGERGAVEELERVLSELASGGAPAGHAGAAPSPVTTAAAGAVPSTSADEGDEATRGSVDAVDEEAGEAAARDEEPADELAALDAMEASGTAGGSGESWDWGGEEVEPESSGATAAGDAAVEKGDAEGTDGRSDDYMDELEFLESLSLDDPDSFDAVSRMLEDEEDR